MDIEATRNKIGPWLPALFCAVLAVIVTIANLASSDNGSTGTYILFMPMCFYFVGAYLTKLKKENSELRDRLDAIDPPSDSGRAVSAQRPENESGEQDADAKRD